MANVEGAAEEQLPDMMTEEASLDEAAAAAKIDCHCGENYFDYLPNEIVLNIFSQLAQTELINAAKVCQRFRNVAKHKRFWRCFSLNNACLKPDDFEVLVQLPIKEFELTASRIYPIEDGSGNSRMHLEKLNLFNIDPRSCKFVLKKCRAKRLVLEGTEIRPRLLNFVTGNKRLEVLSMRSVFYYGCSGYFNHKIFKLCVKLKELDLSHGHMTTAQFHWLCERFPKSVERLKWNHLDLSDYRDDSSFIETIVTRLANLKLLGVSMLHLRKLENLDWLAKLKCLHTLLLCHCDWDEAKRDLFNILRRLSKVRTVVFMIKDELPAKNRQDLDEFKQLLKDRHHIDINIRCIADTKFYWAAINIFGT